MSGTFGYGQLSPWDANDEVNVIAFAIRQMMARMSTMRLVQVKAVHGNGELAASGTVDVLPLVSQVDGNGNSTPHGIVNGIPWARMQGGLRGIICDPVAGDIGYVVVSDRDISNVKASKKPSTPGSARKFNLSDGVYVGGILNAAPTKYLAYLDDRIEEAAPDKIVKKVGDAVITLTTSSAEIAFGANNITIDGSGIHFNGPTFFHGTASGTTTGAAVDFGTSDVVSDGKSLQTHIHGGVATGTHDTGPPV